MRSKKALLNSLTALLGQFVTIVCGFVLPRLILSAFGSSYNGITSSITQFMNCVILLRAGIGGVTRAALYGPLSEKNQEQISRIVNATQAFMKKVSVIFAAALFGFACIYPYLVRDEFDWLFSFSLVIIIGISTVAQNYFGITYQMLIQADQRLYVYSIINIATTILNTIVAAIVIKCGGGIHLVKLASTTVFVINPIVLNIYVKKKYNIDTKAEPDNCAIKQRWDAFAQQIAAFVNNNTDVLVLTMFSNIKEVSVYTVYYMVAGGLCRIEQTLTNGIDAAFGNMLAKKENTVLKRNFSVFEFVTFSTSTFVFLCGAILITPFVMVYTSGVTDVNYSRVSFGVLMCLNQYLFCVRLPYQMIVEAAGHFKQTRNGAILETVMNIVVSIALVINFGLIGVTIGTFCALLFRTIQYAHYSTKHILHTRLEGTIKHIVISVLEVVVVVIILGIVPRISVSSYFSWVMYALQVAIIGALVIGIFSIVFFGEELNAIREKFGALRGKVKKGK